MDSIDAANFEGKSTESQAGKNSEADGPEDTIVSGILKNPILRTIGGRRAVSSDLIESSLIERLLYESPYRETTL